MRIFYALLVLLTTVSAYGADKKFNVGTWTDDSFDDTPTYPVTVDGADFYAPFSFGTTYSGSQTIYTEQELKPLLDDAGTISGLSLLFFDDGYFDEAICSFKVYLTAVEDSEFTPGDDGVYHWLPYSEEDLCATLDYDEYLYYNTYYINYIDLTLPVRYNYTGGNLMMTVVAENTNKTEVLKPNYNDVEAIRCLAMSSDTQTWEEAYSSGDAPAASTCRPPVRVTYKPNSSQSAVEKAETDATTGNAAYYNLQGIKVNNPVKGGIYILRDGSDCIKVRF